MGIDGGLSVRTGVDEPDCSIADMMGVELLGCKAIGLKIEVGGDGFKFAFEIGEKSEGWLRLAGRFSLENEGRVEFEDVEVTGGGKVSEKGCSRIL